MTGPRLRLGVPGIETIAMSLAILALGAASGVAWKTLDASTKPLSVPSTTPSWSAEWADCLGTLHRGSVAQIPRESGSEGSFFKLVRGNTTSRPARPIVEPRPKPDLIPSGARCVRVQVDDGRVVVARVYGEAGARVVLLPDGSLGWPNELVFTDQPFRPLTADELAVSLKDGPYRHFALLRTEHYLVFYTCTPEFARQSGQLLESLYRGLSRKFRELDLPVHDTEFPLVAVVFRNETEFRERRAVAKEVQAYYEVLSNQIFLFETRDRDLESPEVAAMRKPQTVAHEGTHQILMNIGVQPRLARWPAWLVEGIAEFCAPTTTKAGEWAGFGIPNPLHTNTLHELEDTLALQGRGARLMRNRVGQAVGRCTVVDLIQRDELTPTDYALAWGLTHFLATRRSDEFVSYLRTMNRISPLAPDAREVADAAFRNSFGDDVLGMSQPLRRHLAGLPRPDPMPYFAVVFEQLLDDGVIHRGTLVSQSPLIIRQWVDSMASGFNAPYEWHAFRFPTRAAAFASAEQWTRSR